MEGALTVALLILKIFATRNQNLEKCNKHWDKLQK
jgi:hypothetical protein